MLIIARYVEHLDRRFTGIVQLRKQPTMASAGSPLLQEPCEPIYLSEADIR